MKTFIKVLIVIFIIFLFLIQKAIAEAPDRKLSEYTPQELITHFSIEYGVSGKQMYRTMKCESEFDIQAIGDNNGSFGLSQINLRWNPEVTKEQAFDPVFATEFMAKKFSQGKQHRWTCWRDIYQ